MAPPIKQAEAPKQSEAVPADELKQLRDENERLKHERREFEAAMRAAAEKVVLEDSRSEKEGARLFRNEKGQLVDEKYRGTKSYRVRQPHYRQGRMYAVGEVITVTDEKPSKTWVPVEVKPVTAIVDAPESPAPSQRAADQQV